MADLLPGMGWVIESEFSAHGFNWIRCIQKVNNVVVEGAEAVIRVGRQKRIEWLLSHGAFVGSIDRMGAELVEHAEFNSVIRDDDWQIEGIPSHFEYIYLPSLPCACPEVRWKSTSCFCALKRCAIFEIGENASERALVVMDLETRKILWVNRGLHFARGWVFLRNPLLDHGRVSEVELDVPIGSRDLTNGWLEARSCASPGRGCVPVAFALADRKGDFRYLPNPASRMDAFAEVMAFHHVSEIAKRFQNNHGFSWRCEASEVPPSERRFRVLVSYGEASGGFANAFFVNETRANCDRLVFGQVATHNFAYDADIIYHEFAHMVSHRLVGLVSFAVDELGVHHEPWAIDEGASDYWAATTQGDPLVGESLVGSTVEEWPGFRLPRSLEQPLRCPGDLVGDGHLDGRILGGAWWEMRELLGPERADAIVYASLASLLSRSTVSEAAQATISIAQAFFERGDLSAAELRRIHSLLQERGLLDCKRIIPLDEGKEHLAFLGLPSLVNGIGNGFAPLRFSIHVPEGVQSVDIYLRPIGLKEKIGILAKWDHPLQFNQP
ncbi:MAG: hypothetical protein NZM37_09560, partial [Sandaracinaceae bacterium]|nr:hypothetical protein [Sandaracinaceae bacterium]